MAAYHYAVMGEDATRSTFLLLRISIRHLLAINSTMDLKRATWVIRMEIRIALRIATTVINIQFHHPAGNHHHLVLEASLVDLLHHCPMEGTGRTVNDKWRLTTLTPLELIPILVLLGKARLDTADLKIIGPVEVIPIGDNTEDKTVNHGRRAQSSR